MPNETSLHQNIAIGTTGPVVQAGVLNGDVTVHPPPASAEWSRWKLLIVVVMLVVSGDAAVNATHRDASCATPQLARGPILDKLLRERAEGLVLGCPLGPARAAAAGDGQFAVLETADRRYSDRIYWSRETGAHLVLGEIGRRWAATGAEAGPLGFPVSDELANLDHDGRRQEFQHGVVYWHPHRSRGAHPVSGEFFAAWAARDHEVGPLGYPVDAARPSRDGAGSQQDFERGTIITHPTRSNGTHAVMIKIYERWQRSGAEAGEFGYPIADETAHGRVYRQVFEHGEIVWDEAVQAYR